MKQALAFNSSVVKETSLFDFYKLMMFIGLMFDILYQEWAKLAWLMLLKQSLVPI